MHTEFQWPLPAFDDSHTFSPASTIRGQSPTPCSSTPDTPTQSHDITLVTEERPVESSNENDSSFSSLKRANRPPDLDLTPAHAVAILRTSHGKSTEDALKGNPLTHGQTNFDPTQSSTPSKRSTSSQSERVSLVMKPYSCKPCCMHVHVHLHACTCTFACEITFYIYILISLFVEPYIRRFVGILVSGGFTSACILKLENYFQLHNTIIILLINVTLTNILIYTVFMGNIAKSLVYRGAVKVFRYNYFWWNTDSILILIT